jgi:hypothetical protein
LRFSENLHFNRSETGARSQEIKIRLSRPEDQISLVVIRDVDVEGRARRRKISHGREPEHNHDDIERQNGPSVVGAAGAAFGNEVVRDDDEGQDADYERPDLGLDTVSDRPRGLHESGMLTG